VRVGWITVPRAERKTGGCFLVAAAAGPRQADITAIAATITPTPRMTPRFPTGAL
jgi:hypothetical protein